MEYRAIPTSQSAPPNLLSVLLQRQARGSHRLLTTYEGHLSPLAVLSHLVAATPATATVRAALVIS